MRRKSLGCNSIARSSAGDDVEIGAAAHDLIRSEPQRAVACTFAGLDVVLVAMPGADEVCFVGGELLAEPGLVGAEHVLDLVHDHALAAGAALVEAEILISVELALPVEHSDLAAVVKHDAAVAFGEVLDLLDEHFRHVSFHPPCIRHVPQRATLARRDAAGASAFVLGTTLPSEKAKTTLFASCWNSLPTAVRTSSASSRKGFVSGMAGKMTVTEASFPFCQLKPTFGLTPVAVSSALSTARACLEPSTNVLVTSQAVRLIAN